MYIGTKIFDDRTRPTCKRQGHISSGYRIVHDPGDYPLPGMTFSVMQMDSMLAVGSFTPGTVVERKGVRWQVSGEPGVRQTKERVDA